MVYGRLLAAYGRLGWWPGDSPFEVCVGAMLTQQTSWKNVERAIGMMKAENMLSPNKLAALPRENLERLCRPTGFYRQKSIRLRGFCKHIIQHHGGAVENMLAQDLETAREELLSIKGIGEETADSMLLYAGAHPTFVVDAYTTRFLGRLDGWAEKDYGSVQKLFHDKIPPNLEVYREYHALIVEHGKNRCTKSKPRCSGCPLEDMCAEGISRCGP